VKFHLLPIGESFSYQGITYTKSGPLTASSDDTGSNKMIPRSANIQVSKNLQINDITESLDTTLSSIDVADAIKNYHEVVNICLMDIKNEVEDGLYKQIQLKLGNEYRDILKKLSLN
jgi:hypothetical protein